MAEVLVMSYNVYYQNVAARAQQITQLILRHSPDVLGLQEIRPAWVQHIRDFIAEHSYSCYGYGRYGAKIFDEDMCDREEFVPLIWKTEKFDLADCGHFWASSTPDIPCSTAWRDGVAASSPRCFNWAKLKDRQTGREMVFLNCHFDYANDAVRTHSAELTINQMQRFSGNGIPVLMMGDFNSTFESGEYSTIIRSGYDDVRSVAGKTTVSGTFNDWGNRKDGNCIGIDYFFVTRNVTAKSFEVIDDRVDGKHISDHFPILARITF